MSGQWHAEYIPERRVWSVFDDAGLPVVVGISEERAKRIVAAPQTLELLREALEGWPLECECDKPEIDGCWVHETARLLADAGITSSAIDEINAGVTSSAKSVAAQVPHVPSSAIETATRPKAT